MVRRLQRVLRTSTPTHLDVLTAYPSLGRTISSGISDDTLRKYADLGTITAYRFNDRRAFKLEDLNQLIDALPLWNDRNHDESRAGRDREAS